METVQNNKCFTRCTVSPLVNVHQKITRDMAFLSEVKLSISTNTSELLWSTNSIGKKSPKSAPCRRENRRPGTEDAPAGELQVCDALSFLQLRLGDPEY